MSEPVTPARVIKAYLETKKQIDEINEGAEKQTSPLQDLQKKRLAWLKKTLDAQESNNFATDYGTAFKKRSEYISCENFETMVEEHIFKPIIDYCVDRVDDRAVEGTLKEAFKKARFDLFTKAVSKETALEMMGKANEKGQRPNPPPVGIKYAAEIKVHVNSPKAKNSKDEE